MLKFQNAKFMLKFTKTFFYTNNIAYIYILGIIKFIHDE